MKNRTKRKMWVERRNGNNEENAGSFGIREEGVRCGRKCLDIEKWVNVWKDSTRVHSSRTTCCIVNSTRPHNYSYRKSCVDPVSRLRVPRCLHSITLVVGYGIEKYAPAVL